MQDYRWSGKRKFYNSNDDDEYENEDYTSPKKSKKDDSSNKSWNDNSKVYSIDNHIYFHSQ